jgi:hypothetical protein
MSDTLRVLTVRQPWAWAIVHGGKDVENRTRNLAGGYRGPVAIHAGLAKYEQDNEASHAHRAAHGSEVGTEIVFGAVIGVVDLIDSHWSGGDYALHEAGWTPCQHHHCYSQGWAWAGHQHLVLSNPRPLAAPIPATGRLGLWHPDPALEAAIWKQVAP